MAKPTEEEPKPPHEKQKGKEDGRGAFVMAKALIKRARTATHKAVTALIAKAERHWLADFLIEPGGRILACKYGSHAYDQWSVDEILELCGGHCIDHRNTGWWGEAEG